MQNNILYGVKKLFQFSSVQFSHSVVSDSLRLLVGDNLFREALKGEKAVTVYENLLNQIFSSSLVLKH